MVLGGRGGLVEARVDPEVDQKARRQEGLADLGDLRRISVRADLPDQEAPEKAVDRPRLGSVPAGRGEVPGSWWHAGDRQRSLAANRSITGISPR